MHERPVLAASCPSQVDDDHIPTGRCPSRSGRSRRGRPQTARRPTVSRGAHYRTIGKTRPKAGVRELEKQMLIGLRESQT